MDSTETSVPVCYRHPDRITGLACSRCGRNICAECSTDAAVGQLCPDDAQQTDRHQVVRARTLYQRPTFQTAPVSFTILAVTIGIFVIGVVSAAANGWLFDTFAQYNVLIDAGEWWRIYTPILLHANLLHVGFNMYALWLFGPRLEQQVGSPSIAAFYIAAAGAGGIASYLYGSPVPSIGASGAIFGLFGAWLFAYWKLRDRGGQAVFRQLFALLLINLVFGFVVPGVDWRAHLGGLVAGVAMAWLWSIFAVGKPNAIAIRTAISGAFIAVEMAAILLLT
jgi:membrane associated rhomboid family serine protease